MVIRPPGSAPWRRAVSVTAWGVGIVGVLSSVEAAAVPGTRPFGPGERIVMKITYAHLLAGRASLVVEEATQGGRPVLRFVTEAKSEGFFAWLLRYKVEDRTFATWDPESGCSLSIEKHLRERKLVRDQVVAFDPVTGAARVQDTRIRANRFELEPCTLDVLSAFFVTRLRGVSDAGGLSLPLFDNGKRYSLGVRVLGREKLDLPAPLGRKVPTVVIEPLLLAGTGLFVKSGRLSIWLTDDERRIPVRMRTKVPFGSVSADLESYAPPR